jgi:hypothetical protein
MSPNYIPPNPHLASPHDELAINLDKVLNAAPTLRGSPDIAMAVAKMPGDVADNAQYVGALHLINGLARAVHGHIQDNGGGTDLIKAALQYHAENE